METAPTKAATAVPPAALEWNTVTTAPPTNATALKATALLKAAALKATAIQAAALRAAGKAAAGADATGRRRGRGAARRAGRHREQWTSADRLGERPR